jgi:hypothetical protein
LTIATVTAQDLPTSSSAYDGINTIVWSDGGVPSAEVAEAVVQWVQSGGHLVLLPPALGSPWGQGAGNLATAVGVTETPMATSISTHHLQRFFDGDVAPIDLALPTLPTTSPWHAIRQTLDNTPVITRRNLGFGHVTMSSIDPSRRALGPIRSPEGRSAHIGLSTFWGPLLARRDLPSLTQLSNVVREDRLRTMTPRTSQWLDDSLPTAWLHRSTSVSGRLLLAAMLGGMYFIVSGPLMWRVLGARSQRSYMWPAMAVCGLVFGVVVWGTGSIIMPSMTHVKHLTVLDHIAGTAQHRVQSWIDVQLPGSGNRLISTSAAQQRNTNAAFIRAWQPASATTITFGDVRRLPTAAHDSEVVTAARDATTRLHLNWTGVADPEQWGRLFSSTPGNPIGITDGALHGDLTNRLDVPVRNMSIIWIQGPATPRAAGGAWLNPTTAGTPLVDGQWWSPMDGELLPGETLNLSLIQPSPDSDLARTLHDRQMAFSGLSIPTHSQQRRAMELLSLWSLTTPPPWAVPRPTPGTTSGRAQREQAKAPEWDLPIRTFGADLDLGPWLASQALIVFGWIDATDLPIDLHIDGQGADAQDGMILIRWVLPLTDVSDTGTEAA